jgi:hypothetical protein
VRADDLQPAFPPGLNFLETRISADEGDFEPAFVPAPTSIECELPARTASVDGRSQLILHAPARVWFSVPPGQHRLRGVYGLHRSALRSGCKPVVAVSVIVVEGERQSILLEGTLDGSDQSSPSGTAFDVTFETDALSALWLSSRSEGPDQACAWAYWTRVVLE